MKRLLRWLRQRLLPQEDWREEMESHLAMRQEWSERVNGASKGAASSDAHRRFGSRVRAMESLREQYWAHAVQDFVQDIRYALRGWRRQPAVVLAVSGTLVLGIGSATGIFSIVDPLLFRPLPYPHGEQLASVGFMGPVDTHEFMFGNFYLNWKRDQTAFSAMTAMRPSTQCEVVTNQTMQTPCTRVEWNFLRTLGTPPAMGRDFTPAEDRPNAPLSVLISYRFWQSAFGGQRDALGQVLEVDGHKARVIGILSRNFTMPQLGDLDLLLPAQIDPVAARAPGATVFLRAFARLKPGVTFEQARQRIWPLFRQSLKEVPAELRSEVHLMVQSLRDRQIQEAKKASWLLLAAVMLLLAMACVNVINLLLARSEARREEFAMRTALGAGRGRLLRQALTESLLFALPGGVVGVGTAALLVWALKQQATAGFLRLESVQINTRVFLFALAASVLCALLTGLLPALTHLRAQALRGWRTVAGGRNWFRHSLIALQIAFSLLLSTGAILFMSTLIHLESEATGFRPEQLVAATVNASRTPYSTNEKLAAFHNELERRLREIPGTRRFAMSDSIPPAGGVHVRPVSNILVANHQRVAENGGLAAFRYVTPGYFGTMGIALRSGRDFRESERTGTESSIVLSDLLAKKLFPNENPLGQSVALEGAGSPWLTVIGVAANVKNNGLETPESPEYYRVRMKTGMQLGHSDTAVFRTHLTTAQLERWVARQVAAIDPAATVKMAVLAETLRTLNDRPRFLAMVMGVFAAASLLLAGVGLFGVISYLVTSRTRELGVRAALGATRKNLVVLVQSRIMGWVALGMAVGMLGVLGMQRLVSSLLFGVSAADPRPLLAAVGTMMIVAALASWYPSLRAARVDPALSLRTE